MDIADRYTASAMRYFSALALAFIVGSSMLLVRAQSAPASAAGRLTIEQLIDIRHPSSPVWAPDGRHVAFLSERAGIANIFVADVTASSSPAAARALTRYADGQVALSGGEPSAVWTTPQAESGITLSPDGTRVAFVRSLTAPAPGTPAPAAGGRGGRGGGGAGGDLIVR